ncbi:MAG: hypothetical protein Q7S54_00830, partial [bacterium]|nr:hypothetical protein [bacterium]
RPFFGLQHFYMKCRVPASMSMPRSPFALGSPTREHKHRNGNENEDRKEILHALSFAEKL